MIGLVEPLVLKRISAQNSFLPTDPLHSFYPREFTLFTENGMTRVATESMDFPMKTLLLLPLIVAPLLLSGCNTVKGLGEDISGSASWTQDKISGAGDSSVKKSDSDYVNPPQFPKSN